MHKLAMMLAFAALLSPVCRSQGSSEHTPSTNVTYYLVDNSGSMASFRESVDEEIVHMIEGLPDDEGYSVTYFQGRNESDCDNEIDLSKPNTVRASVGCIKRSAMHQGFVPHTCPVGYGFA